jgi:peptidoglycan/xylan/chitin deacetylase (PgdA/CDA1 family)
MYHRVAEQLRGITWNVTPNRFEQQLSGLVANGFRAMALSDLLKTMRLGDSIPHRTFLVTFDDGYESVYLEAWPILKSLQIPATIFLATRYLDSNTPFPFDDWQEAGAAHTKTAWQPLTTAQCSEMAESGLIELGAHTHTHADFQGDPVAFEDDMRACMAVLKDRFGVIEAPFAFPFGRSQLGYHRHGFIDAAKRLGILCALTTEHKLVLNDTDHLSWGRFEAMQADTPMTLAACLDGRYEMIRQWRPDRVMKRIRRSMTFCEP